MPERFLSLAGLVVIDIIDSIPIPETSACLAVFEAARVVATGVQDFTGIGSSFFSSELSIDPFPGAIFAFKVLPVIIFVSSLMGVLYYLRVIQVFINAFARAIDWTMKASGAEALMSAMFVFNGIEATTGVKEYIQKMTRGMMNHSDFYDGRDGRYVYIKCRV